MSQKIIIDTDPGVDDAMAILIALRSPELEILGLTTIFGNHFVDITTLNALRLVELEGNGRIPVAKGAERPLVVAYKEAAAMVHGEDGLGNLNLPLPTGKVIDRPAAQFIVETILANPGEVSLVPVGPLTNIALALLLEPRIVGLVKEVVIMGGAAVTPGNITPVAEANIYHDPHAARLVFGAGWKMTMVGLDVTTQVRMTKAYLQELSVFQNAACQLIAGAAATYQGFHDDFYQMKGDVHTHDPSAIAYLLRPDLFQTTAWPMYVEVEGRCMGQTVPDYHGRWENPAWVNDPTPLQIINVCTGVDSAGVLSLIPAKD